MESVRAKGDRPPAENTSRNTHNVVVELLLAGEGGRVLRPGGLFVLSTPNVSSLRSRFRFLLTGGHNRFKLPLDEAEKHEEAT